MDLYKTAMKAASKKNPPAPYEAAVDALKNVVSRNTIDEAAPDSIGKLIIEEGFSILQSAALYSGMGEENLSACFANSLVAAEILWRRQWLWPLSGDHKIIWAHYPDKTETVVGADFSITFVDIDPVSKESRFRMVVVQAKKLIALAPERLNVERKAFSTKKGETKPADWERQANANLTRAFKNDFDPATYAAEQPNWQIARLLNLRNRFIVEKLPLPSIVYVAWPATPSSEDDLFNDILYEDLHVATKEIAGAKNQKDGSYLQSFAINKQKVFRDYLLDRDTGNAMSEDEFIKAVKLASLHCSAVLVLNASGHELSPELSGVLNGLACSPPPYRPATPASVAKPAPGG